MNLLDIILQKYAESAEKAWLDQDMDARKFAEEKVNAMSNVELISAIEEALEEALAK